MIVNNHEYGITNSKPPGQGGAESECVCVCVCHQGDRFTILNILN